MINTILLSTSNNNVLSHQQQTFNKLIADIEKTKKDIVDTINHLDDLYKQFSTYIIPKETELLNLHLELAKAMDSYTNTYQLNKKLIHKIGLAIVNIINTIANKAEITAEKEALYNKWNKTTLQEEKDNELNHAKTDFANLYEKLTGKTIDLSEVGNDVDAFKKIQQQLLEDHNNFATNKAKAEKKKSKKQLEKEKAAQTNEAFKLKNLRNIYIGLAKLLHPDTEINEVLKVEKEALMKQVTEAYNKKDLLALLQLEIDWVHKNNTNLHQIKDEVLKTYCSVLRDQLQQLKEEKKTIHHNPKYDILFEDDYFKVIGQTKMLDKTSFSIKKNKKRVANFLNIIKGSPDKIELKNFIEDVYFFYEPIEDDFLDTLRFF